MPFADLSDVRCYYELLGSGDPLVLIPGLGTTCRLWDCVVAELSKTFTLVLMDNRGVGASITKRAPTRLTDYAIDVVELMDHLQLHRAHVMGISLGGTIAQELALDHPSRIDRLVLVSTAHRFEPYTREVFKLLAHALRHFSPELFRRTIELLGTAPEYMDAHMPQIEEKIARARQCGISRSALARQLRCLACQPMGEDREYHIHAPTLVIAGEQDMLIPACYAKRMARDIPGSEFLMVPACGHNPLDEKPDFVVPWIVDFLNRRGRSENHEPAQLSVEATV